MRRLPVLGLLLAALLAGGALLAGIGGLAIGDRIGARVSPSATASAGSGGSAGPSVVSPAGSAGLSPSASPSLVPSPGLVPSPSPLPSVAPTAPELPEGALQAALDAWRASSGTPGVSVAIRWADGRTWNGVSGVADARRGTLITPDTAFSLASITKTFVAAETLRLVETGRLSLDRPVAPLLRGVTLDPRITLRMLLDHTSGLPDVFSAVGIDAALLAAPDRRWSLADSLAFTVKGRVTPGSRWTYSNTNYLLLGVLLERVTGQPLATLLRTELFGPLGLSTAYVQVAEPARGPIALGHLVTRVGSAFKAAVIRAGPVQPFASVVTAGGAADDVSASAADVARWAALLYGGEVLRPASLSAMLGDIPRVAPLRPRTPYGLGVEGYTVAGLGPAYGHNGHLDGFRDLVRYLSVQGLSIAILSDADAAPIGPLMTTLLAIATPLGPGCDRCR